MESNTSGSNSFSWADVGWEALRILRARFLGFDQNTAGGVPDYWNPAALRGYDFTFAERIGWKWDTVLAELRARRWMPPAGIALDWGCGTGVAGRRVTAAWPEAVQKLRLHDHSKAALQFAAERAREKFPRLDIALATAETACDLLIVSHVINELAPETLDRLVALASRAQAVLWVEPGTFAASRKLIAARERLRGEFHIVAPCTHAQPCGMLAPGNGRHWCHHFAKIPGFVHTDPGWSRFAAAMEIDITTLPFSWLVLDRRPGALAPPDASRVIGAPRHYKGYAKILSCQADGVRELILQKRDAPELFKEMKKDPGSLYQWQREGDRIHEGKRIT